MRLSRTIVLFLVAVAMWAQATTGTLSGVLKDSSGAVIPSASIELAREGWQRSTVTNPDGTFSFLGLRPDEYIIRVAFPGFVPFEETVTVGVGTVEFPISLTVSGGRQQVSVEDEAGTTLTLDPQRNAAAAVIQGDDLDALPDNPDDLSDMLDAIAGPPIGPDGAQITVDGFTGARLPPKDSIREVRINQNPFSAEYDRVGIGRIEVFTRPGTDTLHGSFGANISDDAFNSRNPFSDNKADYANRIYRGNVSGPVGRRGSLFFNFQRMRIDNNALINAVTLDPDTLAETPVRMSVVTPMRALSVGPRFDYQLATNHTLTVRYGYYDGTRDNIGIGRYSLLSRAYSSANRGHEIQITETSVLTATTVNETRVWLGGGDNNQDGDNSVPAINVSEAFEGGGAQVGASSNVSRHFELQNYTTFVRGGHSLRFGVRLRRSRYSNYSPSNFGGTFVFFGAGDAPDLDVNGQVITGATGQPLMTQISSLEQYRRTLYFQGLGYTGEQIRALGGGASQFTIAGGDPLAEISQFDAGLFAQEDWRLAPNITLSMGMRYEWQTNIERQASYAPRLGIAWAPRGKANASPKTVIRVGSGLFYNRISALTAMQTIRFDGIRQQQFVVPNPDFFPRIPGLTELEAQRQPLNIYQMDPGARAPLTLASAVTLEQQLPARTTLAVTYTYMHSTHYLRAINVNTPLPGTYDPESPGSGVRPYGGDNLFRYQTNGVVNRNILQINARTRFSPRVSLMAFFSMMKANSDVTAEGQPTNPYNFKDDYGPPRWLRSRVFQLVGTLTGPFGLQFSPQFIAQTGPPYDLVIGRDLNGDTITNDRPAIATDLTRPSVVTTRFGAFDTDPLPGQQRVHRNYLTGDGMWNLNMRVSRRFSLGSKPAGGSTGGRADGRTYTLTLDAFANNVFNHVNPGGYTGNLSSPLFAQPTNVLLFRETSNNRKVQIGAQLNF